MRPLTELGLNAPIVTIMREQIKKWWANLFACKSCKARKNYGEAMAERNRGINEQIKRIAKARELDPTNYQDYLT